MQLFVNLYFNQVTRTRFIALLVGPLGIFRWHRSTPSPYEDNQDLLPPS